jgi:DNA topoisomerase-1
VTGSVLKFDGFLKFEEEDKRAREAAKKQASEKRRRRRAVNGATAGAAVADEDEDADKRLPDLNDGEALRWSGCCRSRSLPSRRRATTRRAW